MSKEQQKIHMDEIGITILVNHGDALHAVRIEKEKYETIEFLIKQSIYDLVKTNKKQSDLRRFLEVSE